jgi:allophanate hydrolase subunit 1
MSAAAAIHPGFPDVERVREDCQIKHAEQGYLHREEVQWGVLAVGLVGGAAALWFGGRRLARARRDSLRALIRDELQNSGLLPR